MFSKLCPSIYSKYRLANFVCSVGDCHTLSCMIEAPFKKKTNVKEQ